MRIRRWISRMRPLSYWRMNSASVTSSRWTHAAFLLIAWARLRGFVWCYDVHPSWALLGTVSQSLRASELAQFVIGLLGLSIGVDRFPRLGEGLGIIDRNPVFKHAGG